MKIHNTTIVFGTRTSKTSPSNWIIGYWTGIRSCIITFPGFPSDHKLLTFSLIHPAISETSRGNMSPIRLTTCFSCWLGCCVWFYCGFPCGRRGCRPLSRLPSGFPRGCRTCRPLSRLPCGFPCGRRSCRPLSRLGRWFT